MLGLVDVLIVQTIAAADTAAAIRKRAAGRRSEHRGRSNLQNALLSRGAARRSGRELCDERLHAANSVRPSAPGQRLLAVYFRAQSGRRDTASNAQAGKAEGSQARSPTQGSGQAGRAGSGPSNCTGACTSSDPGQCFPHTAVDTIPCGITVSDSCPAAAVAITKLGGDTDRCAPTPILDAPGFIRHNC